MRVAELTAYLVPLPLKREIKHASFTRTESINLLIRCRLADGTIGWGEGVPRPYVTGETPEGCLQQLAGSNLNPVFDLSASNWDEVITLCDALQFHKQTDNPRGCGSNSLRCAVELSLLDAFGKCFGQPISDLVQHVPEAAGIYLPQSQVRYSTTITSSGAKSERVSALKMRAYGFAQCKIKVGVEGQDDPSRVARIRRWIGRGVDLRLDANEAWKPEEVVRKMEPLRRYRVTCIEQPVAHAEVDALSTMRDAIGVPVMLDESLTSLVDAEHAIASQTCDLFNLRLSKCGGFLSCLRLAALAKRAGLGYQLGCHPGESGVLSAAGRHWASSVSNIRYMEGSYDRHLLSTLPTEEDITFRYGGRAPAITKPGLGVTIREDWLQSNSKSHLVVRGEAT
ncbi:dipeptide epimerase [Rhodopirellula halodulae]|uniref:dipeptide epimerase n=1 Tax=Rhodopirellula halodulae TaxID=2894198 RepID=UPI001E31A48D|nr:dipeptide epimerase [Rhodopirellula sp. JC737]MCC9656128.1 dipeptide epimerase [Rhodopirellula sp. JC737]